MIRVNLLPLKEAEKALGRRQQYAVAALGACVAVMIMLVPYMIQSRQLARLEDEIVTVKADIERYNEQVAEVQDLDRLKIELQTKLRIIEDLNDKRVGPARVLGDLSIATPDNLWLVDFKEGSGLVTLTGMALDIDTIARFMRDLETSKYFHAIDLVETSKTSQLPQLRGVTPNMAFTRFIVKARIDYFGRGGKPAPDLAAPVAENASQRAKEPRA
jgi:type IV pilus assembly protein PilN